MSASANTRRPQSPMFQHMRSRISAQSESVASWSSLPRSSASAAVSSSWRSERVSREEEGVGAQSQRGGQKEVREARRARRTLVLLLGRLALGHAGRLERLELLVDGPEVGLDLDRQQQWSASAIGLTTRAST